MTHRRTAIRDRAMELLGSVDATLSRPRLHNWQPEELPGIAVYTLSEESQTEDVERRTMIRTVVLGIDIVVATTGDVDDDVDALCVAVESALEGDDEANYARIRIRADLEAEGDDQYGENRIRKVFARWLSSEAQATVLSPRLLQRYGQNSRFLSLSLDAKDRHIWTAGFVRAATRLVTDDTGEPVSDLYQVIQAEETVAGHTLGYELQKAAFEDVRAAFYMIAEAPNHGDASDEQKAHGAWYADANGKLGDGSAGYAYQ